MLVEKYQSQIEETAKIDKDIVDVFGHVNTSWVFRETAKEMQFSVFMAEAENIGYKRTKRGEKWQPNDLFDLEIAPGSVSIAEVVKLYKDTRENLETRIGEVEKELAKPSLDKIKKGIYGRKLKRLKDEVIDVLFEEGEVFTVLETYYDSDGNLLEQFKTRLDDKLKSVFLLPRMERFKSEYMLIRQTDHQTILDNLREAKLWR